MQPEEHQRQMRDIEDPGQLGGSGFRGGIGSPGHNGREDLAHRSITTWTRVRHLLDYLQHTWATHVIAYDRGSRDNLVQNLENGLTNTAINSSAQMSRTS